MGRWLSRDPLGEEQFFLIYTSGKPKATIARLRKKALQPGYLFVLNDPVNYLDPVGLEMLYPMDGPARPNPGVDAPDTYVGPSSCNGYTACFPSKCCDYGKLIDDPYPRKAYNACNDFLDLYDNNSEVRCVALCLIREEKMIQGEYSSCSERNAARAGVHAKCYLKCRFFPELFGRWIPEGAEDVGLNMLLKDSFFNPGTVIEKAFF